MNNKFKKGALALGTIATIAAPVAAVVSCGATNSINWSDDDTYAGVKAQEFLNQIKHLGKTKQNAITVGREQMMELQYQSESIRSIMAQSDEFKYENWETRMENAKLINDRADVQKEDNDYTGTDKNIKKGYTDRIAAIDKSIGDNEDKIKKVDGFIAAIKKVTDVVDTSAEYIADKNDVVANFYKNDYKAEDYTIVYKPLTSIHDEKKAYVEDAYKNFYPEFDTKAEGDREWPNELASKFGNAATFNQAIDYLVNQEISAKAFNSYKFEINKDFTVEKKLWAQYIDKNAWKFLIEDTTNNVPGSEHSKDIDTDLDMIKGITATDDSVDPILLEQNILAVKRGESTKDSTGAEATTVAKASALSSLELFLGSTSPDHRVPTDAITKLGNVVKYQHLLVKAVRGKTPEEAWDIKGEDLIKLMDFDQYDDGGIKIGQGIDLLSNTNLFDGSATDFTDFVLKTVSGNSSGTLKTQGSLGVKSEIEYLKAMVPGFSLGALALTKGSGTVTAPTTIANWAGFVKDLKDKMKEEVLKTYTGYTDAADAKDIDVTNNEIETVIKALGDDKVKTIFGGIFQDYFKDKTGLVYTLDKENYIVISQFGIHIIKRTGYTPKEIQGVLSTDIKNMAKDPTLSSSTSIASELNSYYSDTKVMDLLLQDTDYKDALTAKLIEYNKGKTDDVDKVELKDITDVIESVNKLNDKTAVDGAIGDKLENWFVSQIDSGLRTTTVELSEMYQWVKDAQASGQVKTTGTGTPPAPAPTIGGSH